MQPIHDMTWNQKVSRLMVMRWISIIATLAIGIWIFCIQHLVSPDKLNGVSGSVLKWITSTWSPYRDMEHAWIMPAVSIYVLWTRRHSLHEAAGAPSARGLFWVAFGVLILWIGLAAEQARLLLLAMLCWLWAVPFALWGAGVARQLVFPVGYLLLTMPMETVVTFFTVRLRLLSADIASVLLNGFGVDVIRVGTGLHSTSGGGFNLDVADPCSGIRSIFAMTALTAAYAFFTQKTQVRKWLLFFCSVPLAVVGNVVRVMSVACVAKHWGQAAATRFHESAAMYIPFVVAVLLIMEVGRWIARLPLPAWIESKPGASIPSSPAEPVASGARYTWMLCIPLMILGIGMIANHQPHLVEKPITFISPTLPANVGAWWGDQPWFCHNVQCLSTYKAAALQNAQTTVGQTERRLMISEIMARTNDCRCKVCGGPLFAVSLGEKRLLPDDTIIMKRDYVMSDGENWSVSVVVTGLSRDSIHKPENCLPAQGFSLNQIDTISIPLPGREPLKLKRVEMSRIQSDGRAGTSGLVYWFMSEHRETPWHVMRMFWSTWERIAHHRAARWAYISIGANRPFNNEEQLAKLREFLTEFYPKVYHPEEKQ